MELDVRLVTGERDWARLSVERPWWLRNATGLAVPAALLQLPDWVTVGTRAESQPGP